MKRCFALLLLPSVVAAAGLKLRHEASAAPAPSAPAPAPASPAVGPAPAPPPIRPGVVVRITSSKEQIKKDFEGVKEIRYVPLMDEMLGKDFVVKEMDNGGVGLASPDGSQDDTWWFPLASLTPWKSTEDAKKPPAAGSALKVVGLPTRAKIEVSPPGRHDAPWDFSIKGRNLMDPIAPSYSERVDLEKTSMPLPPWMKIKQIVSVECMEKLHKDPMHLCKPEAYANYNAVTEAPTTEKPLTKAEAKKLKDKIKRLKSTIKSLSPKKEEMETLTFKAPGIRDTSASMQSAQGTVEKRHDEVQEGAAKKMKIGKEGSDQRLHTSQGHGERKIVVHYEKDK